jgi:surface protein
MFFGSTFNDDISGWATYNITDMSYMFSGATLFNQPINSFTWDVTGVLDMSYMFADAISFNQDISNWDINNVTNFIGFMSGKDYTNYSPSFYDNLLNSWSTLPVNNNLTIDFGNIQYTSTGLVGRNTLTSPPRSWTINDGGPYVAPTPTQTPTNTATPTQTPTNTPTNTVTPSETPTNTPTQSVTPSNTITNTPTPTQTPTPTPAPITPFVSVFRTTSSSESITLPYVSGGTYSGIIDWGDGNVSANTYSNRTHTYASPSDYTISISGTTSGFSFGYSSLVVFQEKY